MSFELTILGSGSALPTSERNPTAHVLQVHGRFFLIDCGEGTQIRMRQHKISFARIRHIFISHLHGDHYYGLMGLISTRNLLGITSDLHIYSHSDLKELIQPQLDYLKGEMGFKITFHPLNFKTPQLIFSDKMTEAYSFPLRHSLPVCGFLFREKPASAGMIKEKIAELEIPVREIRAIKEGAGFTAADGKYHTHEELTHPAPQPRSYAFCTDTVPHDPALEMIKGVSLLYHEATFQSDLEEWAGKTLHSTARQAADFARKAGAEKLIIGHFSNRYDSDESFLAEARAIFPNTVAACDGQRYTI